MSYQHLLAWIYRNNWRILFLLLAVGSAMAGVGIHPVAGLAVFGVGSISFGYIPANIRVPLFYAEFDNAMAGFFSQNKRALIIGQMLATGTATAKTPMLVPTTDQAMRLFGQGSMLARMLTKYRQQDAFGEVWCLALQEPPAGVKAAGTIAVTGPAAESGTINLYIAGQRIQVPVVAADTATALATAIVAAVTAAPDLPVEASATGATVTLPCKWKGASGNDITIVESFLGQSGGETLPQGVGLTITAMAGGTASPSLTDGAIAAMGDEEYDYVIHPFADTTSLDAFQAEFNDQTGRWSWSRQIYGHCYTALRGTLSSLVAAGQLRNDQHHTIAGFETDVPNPVWEYAAAYGGANAVCLNVDPARPTQTTPLNGILKPRVGKRFILTERQSLLNYGIATSYIGGGLVRVERAITTYQKNSWDQTDVSYLDSETLHTLAEVTRRLRNRITQKYPRHKLADDGTRFAAGQAILTPSVARGEILAEYELMEQDGLVENFELFKKYLIVERDSNNPNRLNVLLPPDLVNQLRIFALLNQFRLQYPANA